MKKTARFCVLAGVLAIATWAGLVTPAHANHLPCDYMNGTYCSLPGSGHSCTFLGDFGFCRCSASHTWVCLY